MTRRTHGAHSRDRRAATAVKTVATATAGPAFRARARAAPRVRLAGCSHSHDRGKLPDLRGLCFGTDSLVREGSNRVSDQVAQSSTVDRLDGPYSGSERSEDEQFDSSVEQVRSSDPLFSRSALRLCPTGTSQAAPLPRGLAWLRSAWPAIVERWLLLGPRRQGEDDFSLLSRLPSPMPSGSRPRCSHVRAPSPSPSPPPRLIVWFGVVWSLWCGVVLSGVVSVVCGDACVRGGLARESVGGVGFEDGGL